tara:strand:+ start:1721 stop:2410 length:690 start_codon:yes stop_codon:yes gene_type:complete
MTEDLHYNQIPIDFGFYTKKTFDNFIIGNNEDLYNSLLNLNKSNHLILIYGNRSSGKTHLCEAVTQSVKSDVIRVNPDTKLQSASLSDFYDLAIIDDIDKLLENSTNEEIIFTIINNQILNKKSTLITSTKELEISDFKLNDLYSRLISDKIYSISDLNDEDKVSFMISLCSERGLEVPGKVLNYIINNCSRDLYFLCAFINSLDYASLSTKRRVTIPFIKQAIKNLPS